MHMAGLCLKGEIFFYIAKDLKIWIFIEKLIPGACTTFMKTIDDAEIWCLLPIHENGQSCNFFCCSHEWFKCLATCGKESQIQSPLSQSLIGL